MYIFLGMQFAHSILKDRCLLLAVRSLIFFTFPECENMKYQNNVHNVMYMGVNFFLLKKKVNITVLMDIKVGCKCMFKPLFIFGLSVPKQV